MADQPSHEMPDEVAVALAELAGVIGDLELILRELHEASDDRGLADSVEAVIGRMTRWIWPLLGELDEEDGYDG